MIEAYGYQWTMQYSGKEFSKAKSKGFFLNFASLPTIYCNKQGERQKDV